MKIGNNKINGHMKVCQFGNLQVDSSQYESLFDDLQVFIKEMMDINPTIYDKTETMSEKIIKFINS